MPTLAQALKTTTPVSPLLRKARRLGIGTIEAMIALAAARGCRHYQLTSQAPVEQVSATELDDSELTILLLIGENAYEPTAIRCAAQLARSSRVQANRLTRLAIMEKCERVLTHIARAGAEHDSEASHFWRGILDRLPALPPRQEPALPHWTRFVSMPGIQRNGVAPPQWLTPDR